MKKASKNKNSKGILSKLLGIITTDADPEVVAEIAEQLVEAVEENPADEEPAVEPAIKKEPTTETSNDEVETPVWAAKILERLERLEAAYSSKTPDSDPLSELEKEVAGEEEVTKPVEEIAEDEEAGLDSEEKTASADEEQAAADEEAESGASTSDARDAIAMAKKQVAKIKDAKTRRDVSDAMAGLIRQTYGIKPSTPKGSYAAIMKAKQNNAKQIKDAYPTFDNMAERQAAYDKRNPHKKG